MNKKRFLVITGTSLLTINTKKSDLNNKIDNLNTYDPILINSIKKCVDNLSNSVDKLNLNKKLTNKLDTLLNNILKDSLTKIDLDNIYMTIDLFDKDKQDEINNKCNLIKSNQKNNLDRKINNFDLKNVLNDEKCKENFEKIVNYILESSIDKNDKDNILNNLNSKVVSQVKDNTENSNLNKIENFYPLLNSNSEKEIKTIINNNNNIKVAKYKNEINDINKDNFFDKNLKELKNSIYKINELDEINNLNNLLDNKIENIINEFYIGDNLTLENINNIKNSTNCLSYEKQKEIEQKINNVITKQKDTVKTTISSLSSFNKDNMFTIKEKINTLPLSNIEKCILKSELNSKIITLINKELSSNNPVSKETLTSIENILEEIPTTMYF